jgi:hypothetical protein
LLILRTNISPASAIKFWELSGLLNASRQKNHGHFPPVSNISLSLVYPIYAQ